MMKPVFVAPRGMLQRKPPHGAACNNCGLCCVATKCELGRHLFGNESGPCPALVHDSRDSHASPHAYTCGVVEMVDDPGLRDAAMLLLRVGEGCDARFNGEPVNHQYHRDCDRRDEARKDTIRAAKKLWGMPESG